MVGIYAGRINYALQLYPSPTKISRATLLSAGLRHLVDIPQDLPLGLWVINSVTEPHTKIEEVVRCSWGERVCVEMEMKEGGSSFFYSKKCSNCLCMERVGAHGNPPSKGVWKTFLLPAWSPSLGLLTKGVPPWPATCHLSHLLKTGMCG